MSSVSSQPGQPVNYKYMILQPLFIIDMITVMFSWIVMSFNEPTLQAWLMKQVCAVLHISHLLKSCRKRAWLRSSALGDAGIRREEPQKSGSQWNLLTIEFSQFRLSESGVGIVFCVQYACYATGALLSGFVSSFGVSYVSKSHFCRIVSEYQPGN